jgi:hypothetical protein
VTAAVRRSELAVSGVFVMVAASVGELGNTGTQHDFQRCVSGDMGAGTTSNLCRVDL